MWNKLNDSYTIDKIVDGVNVTLTVTEYWAYDNDCPIEGSFDFGDEVENDEYLTRFKTGELVNLQIKVKATALGCSGTDYLGGCHVTADNADIELSQIASEHGMANQAIDDCIQAIKNQVETLTPFFVNLPK